MTRRLAQLIEQDGPAALDLFRRIATASEGGTP